MSTITRQPTSNTSPDPGQGGSAVTGATNTGHGSTVTADGVGAGSTSKTCLWSGFAAAVGIVTAATLKFDWSEDGSIPDGNNSFRVQYSLDGGSNWSDAISHADISAPANGSAQVNLPASQDLTLVRVRDRLLAAAASLVATVTASVSNIQIEVQTQDSSILVMM